MFETEMGGDIMFTIVPIFIAVIGIFILVTIVVGAVRGLTQWSKNNNSPILTVFATIVDKRQSVQHYSHIDNTGNGMATSRSSYSTDYYVTFEVESGSRMEFLVPENQYGYLIKGDQGKLTFQGTRFKGFERQ